MNTEVASFVKSIEVVGHDLMGQSGNQAIKMCHIPSMDV